MVRHGYAMAQAYRENRESESSTDAPKESNTVYVIRALTKMMPHNNITRNLLSDSNNATTTTNATAMALLPQRAPIISHWKSQLPLQIVNDYNRYPFGKLPADFAKLYQFDK